MNNPVNWFEIYVQDMSRARKFYESVFQVALTKMGNPEFDMWAFPSSQTGAGASGALIHMSGMSSGGNSTIVYFRCDDCAVEAKRAASSGGRIMKHKFPIGEYGFIALAFDTEGNLFGLHSMK
jgi:predicted enzyme related to lactoylglutathione lyase